MHGKCIKLFGRRNDSRLVGHDEVEADLLFDQVLLEGCAVVALEYEHPILDEAAAVESTRQLRDQASVVRRMDVGRFRLSPMFRCLLPDGDDCVRIREAMLEVVCTGSRCQ